jgi:carbonic anhydrase
VKKLIQGILDFRKNVLPSKRETFAKLAIGQDPDVLFITCSDSRVAPNWFASTDPGDLFVIRNVGNLVPPFEASDSSVAAALEFAVQNLKVQDIVVCGHSGCGAIRTLAQGIDKLKPSNLKHWLYFAEASLGSKEKINSPAELSSEDKLSQQNVLVQLENLRTYPQVQERLNNKTLKIHGWWFDIAQAGVFRFDEATRKFTLIA